MYLFIKRCLDIILSLVGVVILIPISIIIKLVYILMGDEGNVIYTHKRIGKDGKEFQIYKFRTMVQNADVLLEELLKDERYRKEWETNQKIENDPRITKWGRFLRESSLDELPQVINVLKGEMSIVGPRPLVEGELEAHDGLELYQKVKPGITGWWACHGRSDIDYPERLALEYYYVRNLSLKLDLLCIYKTIIAVITRHGAK
jgi:undecaprenyl-phosphate galactose phosphotransferase